MRMILIVSVLISLARFAHAGPSVVFTLKGKSVSEVPIDRLGDVKIALKSGGSFKALFAKDWGKLRNEIIVVSDEVAKGDAPQWNKTLSWQYAVIGNSDYESQWATKGELDTSVDNVGIQLGLFRVEAGNSVAAAFHYYKQKPTGKKIWVKNHWETELKYFTTGAPQGKTALKLAAPTAANAPLASAAAETMLLEQGNSNKLGGFKMTFPAYASSELLKKRDKLGEAAQTGDAQALIAAAMAQVQADDAAAEAGKPAPSKAETSYDGAVMKSLKVNGTPKLTWNKVEGEMRIYAEYSTDVELHAARNDAGAQSEKDFVCKGVTFWMVKAIDKGEWVMASDSADGKLAEKCK